MSSVENKELKTVRVAFLGLGCIGSGLMKLIRGNQEYLANQYGLSIELGKVLVRDLHKERNLDLEGISLTDNPNEVIHDNIDMVVECMGGSGVEVTKELILLALKNRKPVVMSSKKCLAQYGHEIMEAASRYHVPLRCEATVGGAIPIMHALRSMGCSEQVTQIYGIMNATSHYIYSTMEEEHLSFEEALSKAQFNGYAENDPMEDINGLDAWFKLVILLSQGLNKWINDLDYKPVPITSINSEMVQRIKQDGYFIKPMSMAKIEASKVLCYVGPCIVKKDNGLVNVKGNNNVIVVESNVSGKRAFFGQGAGSFPTASVMLDDVIQCVNGGDRGYGNLSEVNEAIGEWKGSFYVCLRWDLSFDEIEGWLQGAGIEISDVAYSSGQSSKQISFIAYDTTQDNLQNILSKGDFMASMIIPYVE